MSVKGCPVGPKSRAPWGLLPQFHRDPLRLLERVGAQYSPLAALPFGPWTLYLASQADAVEAVLRPHKENFRKGPGMEATNPLTGQGLLLSEGDLWRTQRRAVHPVFQEPRMAEYRTVMESEIADASKAWAAAGVVDAAQFGRRLALAVAMRTMFGVIPSASQLEQVSAATVAVTHHFDQRAHSVFRPPYAWPAWIFNRRFHEASAVLAGFVDPLLDRPTTPLLEMVAQAPKERQRAEALTFLLAGHETTGNALAWTLRLLAAHPEVADRVHDEGDDSASLDRLHYARAVALESLRLYPPAWIVTRTALRPVDVMGYELAAGSTFLVSPWVTHRQNEAYPSAEEFLPERWMTDDGVTRKTRTDYQYLAFGGGPRRCPGEEFATTELILAISAICRRWRLVALGSDFPTPSPGLTLVPAGDMRIQLQAR